MNLKPKKKPEITITTRITDQQNKKLNRICKSYGLSKSEVIRQVLEQFIDAQTKKGK